VVRAGANDSQETLARRMATEDGLRRFQVLNGLHAGDRVPSGQLVKIIADR
jgi:predicted Zn-dependent protease